ncbi:hypothetical protein [Streptomyces griseoviridis]|uniref:Minor tail protein n=1 Tax=Streptomyces griseoviridis TaxID=45398 RepID=A0ABT9LHZ2_STRGD|nr:hypothetical protein [Streptomyces griseoviridis]MDP9682357.1 hypothetical protein [Streptomyces griseoviridis]GGS82051.1 hypothetical protein GCM10010240_14290 [Streptomyces griseoviridis]
MAVINPPAWMQAGSYPARNDRLALSGLMSYPGFSVDEATPMRIRQGVKPSYQNYQLKVRAAPTPNMTVIVSGGFCFIDQHDVGGVGTYICANDGDVVVTVPPAGGTGQYRKDTVVASVYDAEYAGAVSEWRLEVIQGPYAATAAQTTRGTLPPNAQILADIAIGPNQTSITTASISDVRQFTVPAGGIVPVPTNAAPTRLHPGQVIYLTDVNRFFYGTQSGGTGELQTAPGAWTAWTPTWGTTTGTNIPSYGNATVDCRYTKIGRTVLFYMKITFGSTTNFGSGAGTENWTWTLPPGLPLAVSEAPVGAVALEPGSTVRASMGMAQGWANDNSKIYFNITGPMVNGGSTSGGIVDATSPFTWASGYKFHLIGQYETTS